MSDPVPILFGPPLEPGTVVDVELTDRDDVEVISLTVPRGHGVTVEHWIRKALQLEPESPASERELP